VYVCQFYSSCIILNKYTNTPPTQKKINTGRAIRVLKRYNTSNSQSPSLPQQWTALLAQAAAKKQPASALEVERVVDATYKAVAERLLHVVVGEQDLLGELQVRDWVVFATVPVCGWHNWWMHVCICLCVFVFYGRMDASLMDACIHLFIHTHQLPTKPPQK
jgi:hypothetical protein